MASGSDGSIILLRDLKEEKAFGLGPSPSKKSKTGNDYSCACLNVLITECDDNFQSYTKWGGEVSTMLRMQIADASGWKIAYCYSEKKSAYFKKNFTISISNFSYDGTVRILYVSEINRIPKSAVMVPDQIKTAASIYTPLIQRQVIAQVSLQGTRSIASTSGKIISDETATAGSNRYRTIYLRDKTGKCKVLLWNSMADFPCHIGNVLGIDDCKGKREGGVLEFAVNRPYEIRVLPTVVSTEVLSGQLISINVAEEELPGVFGMHFVTNNSTIGVKMSLQVILTALKREGMTTSELLEFLPVQCNLTINHNDEVTRMTVD